MNYVEKVEEDRPLELSEQDISSLLDSDRILAAMVNELTSDNCDPLRKRHLQLLEFCNPHSIESLSKAIDNIRDVGGDGDDNEIQFEKGTEEWCFSVLLLKHKSFDSLYFGENPLLLSGHHAPQDAVAELGLACAQCFNRPVQLLRCSRCKVFFYCNAKCQELHWKDGHKKRCSKSGLRRLVNHEVAEHCEEILPLLVYARDHPFPNYHEMWELFERYEFYSEEVHERLTVVFNHIGKNSLKAHARVLGLLLYKIGNNRAMIKVAKLFRDYLCNQSQTVPEAEAAMWYVSMNINAAWHEIGTWCR